MIEYRLVRALYNDAAFQCQSYERSGWQLVHVATRDDLTDIGGLQYEFLFKQDFLDESELTAARAEIARLTAELEQANKANAELTAKLKIADAGWAEAIKRIEAQATNLKIDESLMQGYRETIEELKQEIRIYRDEIPF